jgi:hypothetical protein
MILYFKMILMGVSILLLLGALVFAGGTLFKTGKIWFEGGKFTEGLGALLMGVVITVGILVMAFLVFLVVAGIQATDWGRTS